MPNSGSFHTSPPSSSGTSASQGTRVTVPHKKADVWSAMASAGVLHRQRLASLIALRSLLSEYGQFSNNVRMTLPVQPVFGVTVDADQGKAGDYGPID